MNNEMGHFGKGSRRKEVVESIHHQSDPIVDRNKTQHRHTEIFKALHHHILVHRISYRPSIKGIAFIESFAFPLSKQRFGLAWERLILFFE